MSTVSISPELKTYYSKALLSRLVPVYKPTEYEVAVGKWQAYFGEDGDYRDPNRSKEFDDGYYHAILESCVT